jgi:hypothetical protein
VWRAYTGVVNCVFDQIPIAFPPQTKPRRGGGLRGDKHLPPSTFKGQLFKKSRQLGFGVFIDIWSMAPLNHPAS